MVMRLAIIVEFPDDFYVDTLPPERRLEEIRKRMSNAFDHEWPYAKMGSVKIESIDEQK